MFEPDGTTRLNDASVKEEVMRWLDQDGNSPEMMMCPSFISSMKAMMRSNDQLRPVRDDVEITCGVVGAAAAGSDATGVDAMTVSEFLDDLLVDEDMMDRSQSESTSGRRLYSKAQAQAKANGNRKLDVAMLSSTSTSSKQGSKGEMQTKMSKSKAKAVALKRSTSTASKSKRQLSTYAGDENTIVMAVQLTFTSAGPGAEMTAKAYEDAIGQGRDDRDEGAH
jgi:hypothetical protein